MKNILLPAIFCVLINTVICIGSFSQTVQNPVIKNFVYHDSSLIADTLNVNFGTPILQTSKNSRFNGFRCSSFPVKDKEGRQWMLAFGHTPECKPIKE